MRILFTLCITLFIANVGFSQTRTAKSSTDPCGSTEVFQKVTDPATIKFQREALANLHKAVGGGEKVFGNFSAQFNLNCEGEVLDIKVLENNTDLTDTRVKALLNTHIKFNPAKHVGKEVNYLSKIKFVFKGKQLMAQY